MVQLREKKKPPNNVILLCWCLQCPLCDYLSTPSKEITKYGTVKWSISNYARHLKEYHKEFVSKTRSKKSSQKNVSANNTTNSEDDERVDSGNQNLIQEKISNQITHQATNNLANTSFVAIADLNEDLGEDLSRAELIYEDHSDDEDVFQDFFSKNYVRGSEEVELDVERPRERQLIDQQTASYEVILKRYK